MLLADNFYDAGVDSVTDPLWQERELIISGVGATTTDYESTANATYYQEDQKPGFVYAIIDSNTMTLEFIDEDGEVDFVKSVDDP